VNLKTLILCIIGTTFVLRTTAPLPESLPGLVSDVDDALRDVSRGMHSAVRDLESVAPSGLRGVGVHEARNLVEEKGGKNPSLEQDEPTGGIAEAKMTRERKHETDESANEFIDPMDTAELGLLRKWYREYGSETQPGQKKWEQPPPPPLPVINVANFGVVGTLVAQVIPQGHNVQMNDGVQQTQKFQQPAPGSYNAYGKFQ